MKSYKFCCPRQKPFKARVEWIVEWKACDIRKGETRRGKASTPAAPSILLVTDFLAVYYTKKLCFHPKATSRPPLL